MTPFRRRILLQTAKLYDLAAMTLSFGLATVLVVHETANVSLSDFLSMRISVRNFVIFAGLLVIWHIIFCNFGLYDSRRLSKGRHEVLDTLKANTLGAACLCLVGILFGVGILTPLFLVGFWLISSCAVVTSRLLARHLLSRVRFYGWNLREMVIVGTNTRAVEVARKIESTPALGYRILGFVDEHWKGTNGFLKKGYRLVSDFAGFPFLLREKVIDEVLIALPMKSLYIEASHIAALCDEQGITTRLLPNFFDLRLVGFKVEDLEGMPVITLRGSPEESWQHLLKRAVDIVLSLTAIAALAPLGALAALLVKLTSPGKVFFIQERVGINKRRFCLYKFRTMVEDAEQRQREIEHLNEVSGPVFKIRNDPRITRIGRVLRKTSIDELPQLFNVLKGDMSLVGPRPLPVRDYEGFSQDWQRRRFSVRPGITCLWQVNGRSSISFDKWMELDMQYIDHWSLGLDFKILAKTIPAVVRGSGAA